MKHKILIFILLAGQFLAARTLYVDPASSDTNTGLSDNQAFSSVSKAFLHLKDGDTIRIAAGTYTTSSTLEWGRDLCIIGAGAGSTIIQAAESMTKDINALAVSSVFWQMASDNCDGHTASSEISGITIRYGAAPVSEPMPTGVGGGIRNFSTLKIKDCIIENNVALNGGAIYNDGNLSVENTIIRNNHAFNREGGIYNTSKATFQDLGNITTEHNTEDNIYNTTYTVSDFESGFYGTHGTNGNYEGGYIADSPNFTIEDNPDPSGINKTAKVGKFKRMKNGNWWAYAWFEFPNTDIQYVPMYLHIMIRKPVNSPVCIQVKDRHANPVANTKELISNDQTVTDEWQDLVYEIPFSGMYCYLEVKPDFLNVAPSSRLSEDIDIYFDEIIINGSPAPRTFSEEKLGEYAIPVGTASLQASNTHEQLQFSDLSYTSNLTYDYNTTTGYFRPYKWPETDKDPTKHLEFTITPENGNKVDITKLKIVHKPNTGTLGPSKFSLSWSDNGGETFNDLPETTIASRTSFNTDLFNISGINSTDPVIFRLYAFESLYGTATQKDLWIIDNIELYGAVDAGITSSTPAAAGQNQISVRFAAGNLHFAGISEKTSISIYDMTGRKLLNQTIDRDSNIPFRTQDSLVLVKTLSANGSETTKVLCR